MQQRTDHIHALNRVDGLREGCRGVPADECQRSFFFQWKKRFSGMGVSELGWLRQLEVKNNRLKKLVTDYSVDKMWYRKTVPALLGCRAITLRSANSRSFVFQRDGEFRMIWFDRHDTEVVSLMSVAAD